MSSIVLGAMLFAYILLKPPFFEYCTVSNYRTTTEFSFESFKSVFQQSDTDNKLFEEASRRWRQRRYAFESIQTKLSRIII